MTTAEQRDTQDNATAWTPRHGFVQGWKVFFHYTMTVHLLVLLPAMLLSVAVGVLMPATAFLFGKFLDNFSDFGSCYINGTTFMQRARTSLCSLLGIGGATFLLKGGLFTLWLTFGELQARHDCRSCSAPCLTVTSKGTKLAPLALPHYYPASKGTILFDRPIIASDGLRQIRDLQLEVSQPLAWLW
jgi:hypothetical protein